MKEALFLKQNSKKWNDFEQQLKSEEKANPDRMAELFVEVTDDLAYSRTFYPNSKTTAYLNNIALFVHQAIYKNKKEKTGRFVRFWKYEVPAAIYASRREILLALGVFILAIGIGVISAARDLSFSRLILGDHYVNETLNNIESGDPMAIYKGRSALEMFYTITFNNIKVSFLAFVLGIFFSFGTFYLLLSNGIMLGTFQYLFYHKGVFLTSLSAVWVHGTIEITSIVIAGGAGFVLGNSLLFPGTYSRKESLLKAARQGVKVVAGLVPFFIIAGFLESYVTRHYQNYWVGIVSIGLSALLIFYYFVLYPRKIHKNEPEN